MLRKLTKYEFKASGRLLLPLYAGILIMAVLSGIFTRISSEAFADSAANMPKFISFFTTISMVLYILSIMAGVFLNFIVSIIRFKRNLFDAEGYLMNTLPVTTSQNITAKMFAASAYQILGMLVCAVSVFIFMLISVDKFFINFTDFFELLWKFMLKTESGNLILFAIEAVVIAIVSFFCINLMFYAAISVGHSANSHRVAKSIGVYILLYVIGQIILFYIVPAVISIIPIPYTMLSMHIILIGTAVAEAVYAAAYFLITHYFIKNKLNLQ